MAQGAKGKELALSSALQIPVRIWSTKRSQPRHRAMQNMIWMAWGATGYAWKYLCVQTSHSPCPEFLSRLTLCSNTWKVYCPAPGSSASAGGLMELGMPHSEHSSFFLLFSSLLALMLSSVVLAAMLDYQLWMHIRGYFFSTLCPSVSIQPVPTMSEFLVGHNCFSLTTAFLVQ